MKKTLILIAALTVGIASRAEHHEEQAIGELIDNFHAAAAAADRQ